MCDATILEQISAAFPAISRAEMCLAIVEMEFPEIRDNEFGPDNLVTLDSAAFEIWQHETNEFRDWDEIEIAATNNAH